MKPGESPWWAWPLALTAAILGGGTVLGFVWFGVFLLVMA